MVTKKPMSLARARLYLRKAVEAQGPDFRYSSGVQAECRYVPTTEFGKDDPRATTGCLVGTALKLAGYAVRDWRGSIGMVNHNSMDVDLTAEAVEYFQKAQNLQDNGYTWGEALEAAERYAVAFMEDKKDKDRVCLS